MHDKDCNGDEFLFYIKFPTVKYITEDVTFHSGSINPLKKTANLMCIGSVNDCAFNNINMKWLC